MKSIIGLLSCVLAAGAACSSSAENSTSAGRSSDLGTGLNTVDREYGRPASEVWDAAVSTAKSYDLKIESDSFTIMATSTRVGRMLKTM